MDYILGKEKDNETSLSRMDIKSKNITFCNSADVQLKLARDFLLLMRIHRSKS